MIEPQGLIKYECKSCERQFLIGLVDDKETQLPIKCPFCQGRTDWVSFAEPNDEHYDQLNEMG